MVVFLSHNDEVRVACEDGCQEHVHTVDDAADAADAADAGRGSVNFTWAQEQTKMIRHCMQNEQTRPAIIRRNLENANLFLEGKAPSIQQLNNN